MKTPIKSTIAKLGIETGLPPGKFRGSQLRPKKPTSRTSKQQAYSRLISDILLPGSKNLITEISQAVSILGVGRTDEEIQLAIKLKAAEMYTQIDGCNPKGMAGKFDEIEARYPKGKPGKKARKQKSPA